jgi:uncharacterized membrane protein YoaK (UPF0700 family)
MFKHPGKTRTLSHNLKIASVLSFVAGLVNVAGFLAVQQLTTNVTGHFAYLIEEVYRMNFHLALQFLLFIIFFFLGSFFSNMMIEIISRQSERYMFVIPILLEVCLLTAIGWFGMHHEQEHAQTIAYGLLFSMGLQNSLVTTISNSVVRTTHLTGLFTDLGIELSQLLFYKASNQRQVLKSSIKLRLTIILFFFTGGIAAGAAYSRIGLYTLFIGALLLLAGLMYDAIKFRLILLKRKWHI